MGMKGQWDVMGMGRLRRLQARNVQEAELCSCLGQEHGGRQQRADQVDVRIARSGAAELALAAVLETWGGAKELARLAQLGTMRSQVPEPALHVEVVEHSLMM